MKLGQNNPWIPNKCIGQNEIKTSLLSKIFFMTCPCLNFWKFWLWNWPLKSVSHFVKFSFSEKATKIGAIFQGFDITKYLMSKPWGRFFQILCVSQKVRTLLSKRQSHKDNCTTFCGLLRKAELYKANARYLDCMLDAVGGAKF